MKVRQLTTDAMLAAACAVLGYIAIDLGNIKITFESFPILLGALLFGPLDGLIVGGVGTFIYQMLRYGFSATTFLWILPYVLCGFIVGFWAKKKNFTFTQKALTVTVVLNELLITMLNTGVLYIDSRIYGYYNPVYIFGATGIRLVICIVKAVVFAVALFLVLEPVRKAIRRS